MVDSTCSWSSVSTTSTACGAGTDAITIDEMHGLLKEFRAVYESRLRFLDEQAEPCEDTQQVHIIHIFIYLEVVKRNSYKTQA